MEKELGRGRAAEDGIGHHQRRIIHACNGDSRAEAHDQLALGHVQVIGHLLLPFRHPDDGLRQVEELVPRQVHQRLPPGQLHLLGGGGAAIIHFHPGGSQHLSVVPVELGHVELFRLL